MAHRQSQAGFIGELLQLDLPQTQPPPIASAAVGCNQQRLAPGIKASSFAPPPTPNGSHGKGTGVVIGANIDEPSVAPDVVNAIGISPRHVGTGKVMPLHLVRLLLRAPLLAGIVVISDQLFFLGIDRDHRPAARQIALRGVVDMTELRIAIRMIATLLGLAVTLQTKVQIMQKLRHLGVADGMLAPIQCLS